MGFRDQVKSYLTFIRMEKNAYIQQKNAKAVYILKNIV